MACCKCCCGNADCDPGQEGKCCCGGAEGTCCDVGEYCCSDGCQEDPCEDCEADEDCEYCDEGTTPLEGTGGQLFCCDFGQGGPEQEPTETECGRRYLSVGNLDPFGEVCRAELYDCPDPDDNEIYFVPGTVLIGYCCDGACSEEECPPP